MKKIITIIFRSFLVFGSIFFVLEVDAQEQDAVWYENIGGTVDECSNGEKVYGRRYNKCCNGSIYDLKSDTYGGFEYYYNDKCCEEGKEPLDIDGDGKYECEESCDGGKYLKNGDCCPSGSMPYNAANDGQPKDCCKGMPYTKDDGAKTSITLAATANKCCEGTVYATKEDESKRDCCPKGSVAIGIECTPCSSLTVSQLEENKSACQEDDTTTTSSSESVAGITIGTKCLLNGQCKLNIYDTLGIRKSVRSPGDETSVGIFVQDIVLAITMFIGTVVTIAIIVSGLMRIMAGATGKDPTKAKSGLINALIGLLIVTCSYLIIRVVQYIAKGV